MSYLVTGGTGLIGAYVTRLLVQEGEKVVTFNRNPRRDFLEQLMTKEENQRVEVIQGDVTDLAQLIRTVQEHDVDKIIHMAYLLTTASSASAPPCRAPRARGWPAARTARSHDVRLLRCQISFLGRPW